MSDGNIDVRTMFDDNYLHHYHLDGRECTVRIARVECGELDDQKTRQKKHMPVVYFEGKRVPLAMNRTNTKTIIGLYGAKVKDWIGQWITLYPTTCDAFGKTTECIRVRPTAPRRGKAEPQQPQAPASDTNGDAT